jgi:hypothetical protein
MTREEKVRVALGRYDHYCAFEQPHVLVFKHLEVYSRFQEKTNKLGETIRGVTESWTEDLGVCYEIRLNGNFRGTMVDNISESIRQDLAMCGLLFDSELVEPGLQKSTKIECSSGLSQSLRLPSSLSDLDLERTWLNPNWSPSNKE